MTAMQYGWSKLSRRCMGRLLLSVTCFSGSVVTQWLTPRPLMSFSNKACGCGGSLIMCFWSSAYNSQYGLASWWGAIKGWAGCRGWFLDDQQRTTTTSIVPRFDKTRGSFWQSATLSSTKETSQQRTKQCRMIDTYLWTVYRTSNLSEIRYRHFLLLTHICNQRSFLSRDSRATTHCTNSHFDTPRLCRWINTNPNVSMPRQPLLKKTAGPPRQ